MKTRLLLALVLCASQLSAQNTDTGSESSLASVLKFNGYIDSYYATDNDARATTNRGATNPLNISKDKFALNIVQMTAQADAEKYRAKITLQYGDVAQYDWVSTGEDALTPSNRIQEAYAGLRLTEGLWVDAGFFLTHIGGESISPRDNWLSSVSLCTQFEPIFQSGVRASYDVNSDCNVTLHALNGYNRFNDNNNDKSLGYSLSYKVSENSTLALNGIYGNEQASSAPALNRSLNNLVFSTKLSESLSLKLVGDLSLQKADAESSSSSAAYGAFALLRYSINAKTFVSGRAEFFHDADGILSGASKLCAQSATLGLEYRPATNAYVRCETRYMKDYDMPAAFFENSNGQASHSRLEGIFSLGVSF